MSAERPLAVVTGGSGGMGQAVVSRLLADGFEVHVWDRDSSAVVPDGVRLVEVDVADHESVRAAASGYDRVDLLINAAGIPGGREPIAEQDFAVWDRVIAIDLSGTYYCSVALFPALRAARGVVVNVSSIAGKVMQAGRAHYAVAKGGVEVLTRSLGYEWATEGVRVVAVSPGYMRTPFVEGAIARGELDPTVLDGTVPRGTMASPEEIAAVVVAVAGPDFGFVTGEVITADGGGSLGWLRAGGRREVD